MPSIMLTTEVDSSKGISSLGEAAGHGEGIRGCRG